MSDAAKAKAAKKKANQKAKLGSTAGDKSKKSPAVSRDQVLLISAFTHPCGKIMNSLRRPQSYRGFTTHAPRALPAAWRMLLNISLYVQSSASLAELQNGMGKMDIRCGDRGFTGLGVGPLRGAVSTYIRAVRTPMRRMQCTLQHPAAPINATPAP